MLCSSVIDVLYVPTQLNSIIVLLTIMLSLAVFFEKLTRWPFPYEFVYCHVTSQGGLQSAEQSYGPTVSPSFIVSSLFLLMNGMILKVSGPSTVNKEIMLLHV